MFEKRSDQLEYLDGEVATPELIRNLRELHVINSLLGGYSTTLDALKRTLKPGRNYRLVDIGCGGGDTLRHIQGWCVAHDRKVELVGVDIKPDCIKYSTNHDMTGLIDYVQMDYKDFLKGDAGTDIVHAALFCHHLTDAEVIELIRASLKRRSILVINDLRRDRFAFYGIRLLTRLFSRSRLVVHDAPLSVLRGFTEREWESLIRRAGGKRFEIMKRWAFRHEIIVYE
jgi:2-polyprenyl-3-methyl-5-hydroxy-6-metoxy-1,4-benzoquinol methylase